MKFILLLFIFITPSLQASSTHKGLLATIAPVSPFVKIVDTVINEDIVYKKNWFSYGLNIENGTNEEMTVVSFDVEVRDIDGSIKLKKVFNPTQFSETPSNEYFEMIPANSKSQLIDNLKFIVDQIPEPKLKNVYRFTVIVKVLGWKGTYEKPITPFYLEATARTN